MVASLLKIVSTGMQDERLQPPKDQPDLGAFLTVMMKTGRYGTAWARIEFDTKPEFGQSAVIRLPVQGELIGRIMLVTTMPDIKTQQDKAYRARKVPKLYSRNYQSAQLVNDFQYTSSYKTVYAARSNSVPVPNGYADFSGVQLDDLRVGATYTLNFSSQIQSVFSLYLTDSGLPQSTFNIINRDSLIIAAPGSEFISYSYDTVNWTPVTQPSGVYNQSTINDIQWNGSQWLAVGKIGPTGGNNIRTIGSSDPNITVNFPVTTGASYSVAWNGKTGNESLYVMIGEGDNDGQKFTNIDGTLGTITRSVDGINWIPAYNPSEPIDYDGKNGSIAWNGERFIASGFRVTNAVQAKSGMMYSTDAVNWSLIFDYSIQNIYPKSKVMTLTGSITGNRLITTREPSSLVVGSKIYNTEKFPSGVSVTAVITSAVITATISGSLLTVTTVVSGSVMVGQRFSYGAGPSAITLEIIEEGDSPSTYVLNNATPITASLATYTLGIGDTAVIPPAVISASISGLFLTVISVTSGSVMVGQRFSYGSGPSAITLELIDNTASQHVYRLNNITPITASASTYTLTMPNAVGAYILDLPAGWEGDVSSTSMRDYPLLQSVQVRKIVWNGLTGAASLTVAVGKWIFSDSQIFGIASSPNGFDWTLQGPVLTGGTGTGQTNEIIISTLLDVCWTGYIWIAIGEFASDGEISTSSDAINWSPPVLPNGTFELGALSIAASSTGVIIIGGWQNNDGTVGSIVRGSNNQLGYDWLTIKKPTSINTDIITINSIIYTGGRDKNGVVTPGIYIAGGAWSDLTGAQYGALSYSTDGLTWTQAVFPNALQNNDLNHPGTGFTNSIASDGTSDTPPSIYIAVGNWYDKIDTNAFRGSICRSIDGQDWPIYLDPGPSFGIAGTGYGIVYYPALYSDSSGYWIAVGSWGSVSDGNSGTIAISDDETGTSWSTAPSDGDIPFTPGGTAYGIASDGLGNFIAVGEWDYLVTKNGISTLYRITILHGVDNGAGTLTWNAILDIPNPITNSAINDLYAVGRGVFYDVFTNEFNIVGCWTAGVIQYSIINMYISPDTESGVTITSVTGPTDQYGEIISGTGRSIATNISGKTIVTGQWGNSTISGSSGRGAAFSTPVNPTGTLGKSNIGTGILWNGNNWVACGNWFDQFNTNYANITVFSYGLVWYQAFDPPNSLNQMRVDNRPSSILWDSYRSQWVASGVWSVGTRSRYIITSSDGVNWSVPFNYSCIGIEEIVYGLQSIPSGIFVIGRWQGQTKLISTSSDGIIWSSPSSIPGVYDSDIYNIAWNGIRWVAAGKFKDVTVTELGGLAFSSDGVIWTVARFPRGITETKTGQGLYGVAWNGTIFLAYGATFDINQNGQGFTTTSTDGVNWSDPINQPFIAAANSISLVWSGTFWLAASAWRSGNTANETILGSFITSTDGITWTTPISPSGTANTTGIYSVAYNGSMWIAVGSWTSSLGTYNMAISYNGTTWTVVNSQIVNAMYLIQSIKWNGTIWIGGGTAETYNIIRSYDGINWTSQVLGGNIGVTAIATKRTLPYTSAQLFSPFIRNVSVTTNPPVVPYVKDSVVTWSNDPVYKNGTNYQTFLSSTNSPTFTFTATKRTQWLTFGTYYNLAAVTITLTLPSQSPTLDMNVKSDLIGPHFSWTNSLGNALINSASLRIGGVLVDTIPGRLLEVLDEFQTPLERVNEVSNQTCRQINGFNQSSFGTQTTAQVVRTPLPFWFSRGDPGCFLPIDALNVDEVRLTVNFNPITSLYYTDSRATNPDGSFIKTDTPGAGLWPMAGSSFYYEDSSGTLLSGLEPIDAPGQRFSPFPNVKMTTDLTMPESYLMVEYIYLDKAEANRFRIADIQVPVVQHYTFDPVDNQKNPHLRIPLVIPNPTRDLFFYCNRYEAQGYNATFLGTRDLSNTLIPGKLWWPDVTGLDNHYYGTIKSGFSTRYSEPIRWLSLDYSETLNRYSTENVALFRSVIPSLEQRKAPLVNRYYYNLPFGIQNGFTPFSMPIGEANLDKVLRMNLSLGFHGRTGNLTDDFVDRYNTYVFAETYNILRVYGGRGGMMFAY